MDKKIRMLLSILFAVLVMGNNVFAKNTLNTHETNIESNRETNSQEEEFDVLLNDNVSFEKFEKIIHDYYPQIDLLKTEEILLVHMKLPSNINKMEFLNDEKIQPYIYLQGNLADINIPQNPFSKVGLNKKNIIISELFQTRMTDEELFDAMAWHVDEVTEDRKALDIAKGEETKIAIIDSGIDIHHPALKGKINLQDSYSYVTEDSNVVDQNGHGTGVAGIITQIAPLSEMTIYKVIEEEDGESKWTIDAILRAVNDGNDIINISLGTYKCEDIESELLTIEAFERAVEYAKNKNCLIVASAGNKSINLDQYYEINHIKHLPGGIEGSITVSSVYKNSIASYSNYGTEVDFCAPGGDIVYINEALDLSQWLYVLYPMNLDNGLSSLGIPQGYTFNCGTSFSTPAIAAGAADILSFHLKENLNTSIDQIMEELIRGSKDIGASGKDIYFGYGLVNIYHSLNRLR